MIVLNRLAAAVPTLFLVSLLVFWFTDLIPGDPARIMAGPMATNEEVQVIRDAMGLNEPAMVRYTRFVQGLVNPDVAVSLRTGRPITTEISERLPNTLIIAIGGLAVGLLIGTITGVICAIRQGTWLDALISVFTLTGISMPIYWLGLLCIWFFAVYLGWLPAASTPLHYLLPILTVATRPAAMFSRLVTASLLEVMGRDYLDTARAKGLSEKAVVTRHALRNSLVPAVNVAGVQFGGLLGGSVITETIFAIPGIGRLLVDAVSRADYPVIQYSILLFAFFFILINLVTDILTLWLDPRVRTSLDMD